MSAHQVSLVVLSTSVPIADCCLADDVGSGRGRYQDHSRPVSRPPSVPDIDPHRIRRSTDSGLSDPAWGGNSPSHWRPGMIRLSD